MVLTGKKMSRDLRKPGQTRVERVGRRISLFGKLVR